MKPYLKALLPWGLLYVIVFVIPYTMGFRVFINMTNSLPGHVYVYRIGTTPKKGELVTLKHPKFPCLITKRVIGSTGDKVSVENNVVLINDESVGPFVCFTSKGDPLVPIDVKTIPENRWFVAGSHPRSHDSRYASFGLIHTHQIEGRAWEVF